MAVMKNIDGTELMIDCKCGCDRGMRFKIDKDDPDMYCFLTYTNGSFYTEQGDSLIGNWAKKLSKIWAILRNKDYYYADIAMSQAEFETFKDYINGV